MGQSSSSRRRSRRHSNSQHHHHLHSDSHPPPLPPPPFPGFSLYAASGYQSGGNSVRTYDPLMGQSNYPSSYYDHSNQGSGWWPSSTSSSSSNSASSAGMKVSSSQPAPAAVHQKATTIKNHVNLHRNSIQLELDERNPDSHLVSFTFDSLVDGSFRIIYFAREGSNCSFSAVYPDMYMPVKIPFQKGVSQNFRQPSGSGIDLGFFALDDLSKPSYGDVFPLVICAESCSPPACAQITQAIIEKNGNGPFQVKVMKQILWVDGNRYELQEIFDLGISTEADFDDNDGEPEKECVICMSEPRDTALLPCRHMCMCSECAKALRRQSNKCPICRQPIEKLIEIPNQRREGTYRDQDQTL